MTVSIQSLASWITQTDCLYGINASALAAYISLEDVLDADASLGVAWPFGHVACLELG